MAVLDSLDTDALRDADPKEREEEIMKKFGWEEAHYQGRRTTWMHWKPKMWALFDEPYSSLQAKVRTITPFES